MLLDIGNPYWQGVMSAVAFHLDGKHVVGGYDGGIRRWRLTDGQEVGKQTGLGIEVQVICVSRDDKWVVCGTKKGASVWDRELQKKVIDVEGEIAVDSVDVSPGSTRFATGTRNGQANIWSMTRTGSIWSITGTGKRLVGPLKHDYWVTGIRFSPSGEHIATACYTGIRVFDSQTGDKLVTIINADPPRWGASTPLAWSSDGQKIFAATSDNKIEVFDTSTGIQLAESRILRDGNNGVPFITLAANGKFIATFANRSILFLDAYTLARIGPVIEDEKQIWSVAISPDSTRLATARFDGKIAIRDLGEILPDVYGPFDVSICALYRSIPNVDKMCRYLLVNRFNKRNSLRHWVTTKTKHLALPRQDFVTRWVALIPSFRTYDGKFLRNPVEPNPRDTAKATTLISSRYQSSISPSTRILMIA